MGDFREDFSAGGVIRANDLNGISNHIDGHLIPVSESTQEKESGNWDLGSSAYKWRNLYLSSGVYLGGTASTNLIDNISSGTYTAQINFNGSHTGMTSTAMNGVWNRIGNVVFFQINCEISNKGSSTGYATIDFPSFSGKTLAVSSFNAGHCVGVTGNWVSFGVSGGLGLGDIAGNQLDDTDFSSSFYIRASGAGILS